MLAEMSDPALRMRQMLTAITEWCKDPSKNNSTRLVDAMVEHERKGCTLSSQNYEQTFSKLPGSTPTIWANTDTPSGECGIQDTSSFIAREQSGFVFWDYVSRKTVHNKDGRTALGVPCFGLDENAYPHSWRSKSVNMMCDHFSFSP